MPKYYQFEQFQFSLQLHTCSEEHIPYTTDRGCWGNGRLRVAGIMRLFLADPAVFHCKIQRNLDSVRTEVSDAFGFSGHL